MKTIAFFNTRGGIGNTTLVYHLAWMFAELGLRVVAADLDPQANLTTMMLDDDNRFRLQDHEISTLYDGVAPLIEHGQAVEPYILPVTEQLGLLVGDLQLSLLEDALSREWTQCRAESPIDRGRAFKVTTSLARAVQRGAKQFDADVALIDIGPNLGAINRCAMLGADDLVIPMAPDLFSLRGLQNVGSAVSQWRTGWQGRLEQAPTTRDPWPNGEMRPAGYVISRFSSYVGEKSVQFRRWISRVPGVYHQAMMDERNPVAFDVSQDPACLGWLKDYRTLMPMAQDANKPIFLLKPADGAIGAHQSARMSAYADFRTLAERIAAEAEIPLPAPGDLFS